MYGLSKHPLHDFRYWIIRKLSCPVRCLPAKTPVIGGRSFLELAIICLAYGIILAITSKADTGGSGSITSAIGGICVLLGLRHNVFTMVFAISFERALYWHKLAAILFLATGAIHGSYCLLEDYHISRHNNRNLSGVILEAAMLATSLSYLVKYYFFEAFYYFHFVVYAAIIVLSLIHGATLTAAAGLLWAIDLLLRYIVSINKYEKALFTLLPGDVVKITVPKRFNYDPAQYVFIMIPQLSFLQFHPFTISSSPHEDHISIHIRALGNWTTDLQDLVLKQCAENNIDGITTSCRMDLYMEGPFGLHQVNFESPKYEAFLLISGGIGVTPTQSIFNHLRHQYVNENRKIQKCFVVWSLKDKALLDATHFDQDNELGSNNYNNIDSLNSQVSKKNPQKGNSQLKRQHSARVSIPRTSSNQDNGNLPLSFQPHLLTDWITTRSGKSLRKCHVDDVEEATQIQLSETVAVSNSRGSDSANEVSQALRFEDDLDKADVFHCEFYLTSIRNQSEFKAANIRPDEQEYLRFNRPNLPHIFARMDQYCKDKNIDKVAVAVCGPGVMVEEVKDLCKMKHEVEYHLHSEEFSF